MKHPQNKNETPFSSNAIRLSVREWLIAAGIILVIVLGLPPVWRGLEVSSFSAGYRIPYNLSEDYWLFKQVARSVSGQGQTLVLGDSVVWGHYVGRDQTLSHYLNEFSGSEKFVNLGLDGSHPMALHGLLRYYGKAIRGEKILLHLNLLWLSSPEADLQTGKEFRFNHPRLVPQFTPRIPCYTESVSGRIGIILERFLPVFQWVRHLQVRNFANTDIPLWTIEHPYANLLARIFLKPGGIPEEREGDIRSEEPSKPAQAQALPWVEFETSLQWEAFERLVALLISRGNDVLVLEGPLNEYALSPNSIKKYRALVIKAENSLEQMDIPFLRLPLLPGDVYADTSHPDGQGYELLADYIWKRLKE